VTSSAVALELTDAAASIAHERRLLLVLAITTIPYSLMQTLAIPAIPRFEQDLHTSFAWATWVATGFLLVSAVATPIIGRLGDQFGRRRLLILVLILFLAGTVGAAGAPNIELLIMCRCFQGVSGALFPLAFSVLRDEFHVERSRQAIAILAAMMSVGNGLGFVLAGLILDHTTWRFIFVLPAAWTLVGLILVVRYVPSRRPDAQARVDLRGAILLAATLGMFLVGITEGATSGYRAPHVLVLLVSSAVAAALWVRTALVTTSPLVDIRLMRKRALLLTAVVAGMSSIVNFQIFALIPAFVESPRHAPAAVRHLVHYGLDASALTVGLLFLPQTIAALIFAPLAPVIARRLRVKWTLVVGLAGLVLPAAAVVLWHTSIVEFAIILGVQGACFGLIFTSVMTIAVQVGPAEDTGVVTGVVTTFRTVGAQLGAQGGVALLSAMTIAGTAIPTEAAYQLSFGVAAGVALVAAALASFITPWRRLNPVV
jgi:EmrB/QacA subfamily drug resistance transporter